MNAIVCVTVRFARVFLHLYNDRKWKDLKAETAFQILCVYFKQISVERKKSQLYCELLDNINFAFRLT